MLPGFLQSSYQIYKQDTDAIAKWLAVKAKQCGYPADLLSPANPPTSVPQPTGPSQRLKGAARKKAKIGAKAVPRPADGPSNRVNAPTTPSYTIKVKDFTALAECVARFTKPAVRVPVTVANALTRAIELRQQHNARAREQVESEPSIDHEESNQSHAYFLGVLERTQEILKPRMPSETINDFSSKPSSKAGDHPSPDTQANGQISNMFENLDIQEPSQSFLDAPDVERTTVINAVKEPNYEVEQVQNIEEQYLAAHCLFEDVRDIRSLLHQLWKKYRNGNLDLVAVSVTTNTAIDFVRSIEQDCLQRFPDNSDYKSIMQVFYCAQCLDRGHDPNTKEYPNDPFNFELYDLAEAVMLPTYIVLESLQTRVAPNQALLYKPGCFGTHDTRTTWTEKSGREKFHDDRRVLGEAFTDFTVFAVITSGWTVVEDELIRGIRHMAPGKPIPLWLVFATQCFLDTQHVLGPDLANGHKKLRETASAIGFSIKQNLEFHKSLHVETWPKQKDAQFGALLSIIEQWIGQDLVANQIKLAKAAAALPPPKPFRLLRQYPLLCGLLSFAIQMKAQELGIDFANAWGSILCASHLYNATRQEKLLPKAWRDMEILIALQGPEKLFVGSPPRDVDAYFKRLLLSMGYPVTAFARNRRRNAPIAFNSPRSLSELCAVGALFKGRYCRNEQTVTWTPESVKPILEAKMDDDSDLDDDSEDEDLDKRSPKVKTAASGSLLRRPQKNSGRIPTIDFLQDLANALEAEELELSLDYLRLHRDCWMLFDGVNDACKPQLLEQVGPGYIEEESRLPFVVGYVFMVATETNGVANLLLPRRSGVQVSSRLLRTAAAAIAGFIESGVGGINRKFVAQRLRCQELDSGLLDDLDMPD